LRENSVYYSLQHLIQCKVLIDLTPLSLVIHCELRKSDMEMWLFKLNPLD